VAILTDNTLDFISSDVQQTVRIGIRLGELLQPGDLLCLYGDMGAGKTTLARGIGRGWGTNARITSPTFALVNPYPRARDGVLLYHMDAWRLASEADVITTGIEDLLEQSAAFMIEWPERLAGWLPPDQLHIRLRHVSETRRGLRLEAHGPRPTALLKAFRQSAFGF
jgi:tRNA threonylcarbamoyladenosine biosynthesis protein TsaE